MITAQKCCRNEDDMKTLSYQSRKEGKKTRTNINRLVI